MATLRSFVFLSVLYLLHGCNSSLIQLKDNGYEGIIIAINPDVPENEALITAIQDMVTEASTYLFKATESRTYFKNVNILIPGTWKTKPEYMRPRYESYKHATVIIAPPALPGRDEPYTKHFSQCGEVGEFIHLTPEFLLGNKENKYGPPGRLLVHEWAHLRWGVFDEYNEDEPFYAASNKKIEATRCSKDITGINRVYKVEGGGSDILRPCRFNSTTKLYEEGCQFFPDKKQTAKTSIMFMQAIDSVVEFCNKKNHNKEAPNLQNKKCNSRSTWEVISTSEDIKNTMPMMAPPPLPVFSLLRVGERIVCLVLDKSGSMGEYNRLTRMNQAAKHFLLQTVENKSWVGIIVFDDMGYVQSPVTQITSEKDRQTLAAKLPLKSNGGTSICSGIRMALQEIKFVYPRINGSEIILVTDGENNSPINCVEEMVQSGAILHFIAMGPNADKNGIAMSTLTGGKHIFVSDVSESNGLVEAFSALTSENTLLSEKSLQLESRGKKLNQSQWINDTIIIDSTVGKDTFFLITWVKAFPLISLWDPEGTKMENFTGDKDSNMAYLSIPGIAKAGIWTYSLQAKANEEILTITVNSQAANPSVPPITVNAKMNQDTNKFPNPMVVYTEVLQGFAPILGASVTAIIESSQETTILELLDNGAGADSIKNDGVYSRYFMNYKDNGRYNLKVRVHGGATAKRSLRHPPNTAAFVPGWVVNGEIQGTPPRPETDKEIKTNVENFSRMAAGGAFVLEGVPSSFNRSPTDYFPPSQITDLEATRDGNMITLTWTAPGDDLDIGKVQQYIIRKSGNILDLKDNFDGALQVSTENLIPKEVNSKETFAFKENVARVGTTHMFFAIQSVDNSNQKSEISNIAQVALFIPQADDDQEENHPSSGTSISTVVLAVVGTVAVVSTIVSTTICIINRRRSSNSPMTGF
ncbi:calcium-activated chloride channel regulator 4-like [Sorex araneus]|uniref:calcium-activated chloride channel regulator 4-like n=1 Tax=Sorex araneus TaxID=42254 RepID=UPI002433A3C4|nr:calcium-activated chloride channel regulator 4-like [Sorex araneus]